MSPRSSFRVAAVVTVLGALALVAGCSAAPVGAGGDVTAKESAAEYRGPALIWSDTSGGLSAECSIATEAAVPSQIAGYGCTLGAATSAGSATVPESAYAWACPESIVSAGVVPAGGFGLGTGAISESATIVVDPSSEEAACFGDANSGWVLVVDTIRYKSNIKGGCQGGCF